MTAAPRPRPGFTLIELLVVIALIAVLAGLTAGAVFRVQASQKKSASEATLRKLNAGLGKRYKAIVDDSKDERKNPIPPSLVAFAGGDRERAQAMWLYMRLTNEFPTTYSEATSPVVVGTGGNVTALPPRQVFVQGLPAALDGESHVIQSAACFYVAVTSLANRGEYFGDDGTQNQEGEHTLTGGAKVKVFKDTYGNPIAFCRFGFPPEITGDPAYKTTAVSKDFADPLGKLPKTTAVGPWTPAQLDVFWAGVNPPSGPKTNFGVTGRHSTAFGGVPGTYPQQTALPWVPTVVSAGPDGKPEPVLGGGDDLAGFRLTREGSQN